MGANFSGRTSGSTLRVYGREWSARPSPPSTTESSRELLDQTVAQHVGHLEHVAFDRAVLADAGVVLVPGLDFGPHTAQHYIRLSYATSMGHLEEAGERLAKLFGR